MALRNIVTEGDEVLTKRCRPVERFDTHLKTLIQDMKETLLRADGVGLAAPQVGILRRLALVRDEVDENRIFVLVNPSIIAFSGRQTPVEGCLSIPGIWGKTVRPATVTVRAQDENGTWFEVTRGGITAVCFCHELDHLDGKLFREHVTEYVEPN